MTPSDYEQFVCRHFIKKGYTADVTPPTNDYGIDVVASKDGETIGIQAKMFGRTGRKINRQMIMELHGAKDYYGCHKAVLVTNGQVLETASTVAEQLGIEIVFLEPVEEVASLRTTRTGDCFEIIWENYIKPLEGRTLVRANGKTNTIVSVDWSGVERITSNGETGTIKIEIFRWAINELLSTGSITRKRINDEYAGRASSGIVLLLSNVPFFEHRQNPSRIVLNREEYDNCIANRATGKGKA